MSVTMDLHSTLAKHFKYKKKSKRMIIIHCDEVLFREQVGSCPVGLLSVKSWSQQHTKTEIASWFAKVEWRREHEGNQNLIP